MSKQSDLVNIAQGDTITVDHATGRVGIGTSSPATALDVVGTVTADGLTVDGAASIGSSTAKTKFYSDSTYNGIYNGSGLYANESIYMGAGSLFFYTATDQRMKIDSSGDISFYEDTGTTPKFFWDASAEALGIGTTTPAQKLDVTGGYALLDGLRIGGGDTTNTIYQATGALSLSTGSASGIVFKTNLTDRMAIDASGNVGIGTSSPQAKLQVLDTLKVSTADQSSGSVILGDGGSTAFNVGIARWNGATNATGAGGVGYFAQGSINAGGHFFYTGDAAAGSTTERMRIDSSGNVGIGTSSPAATFGSRVLQVAGTADANSEIRLTHTTSGTGSTDGFTMLLTGSEGYLYNRENGSLILGTNNTERLRIDSSGNLLVRTTANRQGFAIQTVNQDGFAIHTADESANAAQFAAGGNVALSASGNYAVVNGKDGILFGTIDGTTERMRIDGSGRLLVGGTTAGSKLTVTNHNSGGTVQTCAGIVFSNQANPSATFMGSGIFNNAFRDVSSSSITAGIWFENGAGQAGYAALKSDIVFGAQDYGQNWNTPQERMRLDYGGNLRLGTGNGSNTTGPMLHGGNVSSYSYNGFGIWPEADGASAVKLLSQVNNTAGRIHFRFTNPNGVVGQITTSGSSTSYATSSDYRLKENVVDLTGATDRLKQIPVHRFNFIADPNTTVDGFLAHEVQSIVPEAVTGTKDGMRTEEYEVTPAVYENGEVVTEAVMGTREVPDYQGIDQSKLVPLLTAALQEALARIETLEARMAALET